MSRSSRGSGRQGWQAPNARFTEADGRAMLAALAESGLSGVEFARKHGMPAHKVFYWRYRLKEAGSPLVMRAGAESGQKTIGFVAAKLRVSSSSYDMPSPPAAEQTLELELPSGRSARVSGRWDAASIALWLSAAQEVPC